MKQKIIHAFQKSPQWEDVKIVCQTLESHGFLGWIAGGAVRDGLLGLIPNDFDVASNATPDDIEKLFSKTVSVGKQFGVVRVVTSRGDIEIAAFRKDGLYIDGRRPDHVEYSTPELDAERRDFTINALFYDVKNGKICDYVNGQKDLGKKTIKTVGDAYQRFSEDKLRILRAVRFVSQLGFRMEGKTLKAVKEMAPEILKVSGERFYEEMTKLLKGKNVELAMGILKSTGLAKVISPRLDIKTVNFKKAKLDKSWKVLKTSRKVSATVFNWGLFLSQIRDANARSKVISNLKTSQVTKNSIKSVFDIADALGKFMKLSMSEKRHLSAKAEAVASLEIMKITRQGSAALHKTLAVFLKKYPELPAPIVTSGTLFSLGLETGATFGKVMKDAYEAQLNGKFNTAKQALLWLKRNI